MYIIALETIFNKPTKKFLMISDKLNYNKYISYIIVLLLPISRTTISVFSVNITLLWFNFYKIIVYSTFYENLKIIFISIVYVTSITEILFINQFPMNLMALFISIFILSNQLGKTIL